MDNINTLWVSRSLKEIYHPNLQFPSYSDFQGGFFGGVLQPPTLKFVSLSPLSSFPAAAGSCKKKKKKL